jgi:maleylacetate reductase
MTVATPEWLFLSTGLRAVDHSIEGMCSADANDYSDAQAVRALSLLTSGLARVKADPTDLDARLDCQMGAWLSMGTIATGVPMGASHGIGYVLGAAFDVPHGYTSCVMLPAVLEWNRSATVDRQTAVAAAMGGAGEQASELVGRLITELGLPRTLGAVGIGRDSYDYIATAAMDTRWMPFNPRPVSGPADILEILELAS